MGQRWSMLKNGYLEESESEEEEEEEDEEDTEAEAEGYSVSLAQLRQSQATTEASSKVPAFDDRGSTYPNDIELANLQSGKTTVDTARRAKNASAAPTVSTSHFSSVKGSLNDSEAPGCRLRPRKLALEHKREAYREALHGQFAIRNLGVAVPSPSLLSLAPDVMKVREIGEDEMLRSPAGATGHVKVGGKRNLLQSTESQPPFSPAQTLLMFQLDPKRKRSAGLPSVAFDCPGCPAAPVNLKLPTLLEGPSKEAGGSEAVLDMGTGDAVVGRSVKVVEGQGEGHKGAQRLYQINHDGGKEEALEWLDFEPYLIARGARARPRPRFKTVDELIYKKRKRPGRQVRRR